MYSEWFCIDDTTAVEKLLTLTDIVVYAHDWKLSVAL